MHRKNENENSNIEYIWDCSLRYFLTFLLIKSIALFSDIHLISCYCYVFSTSIASKSRRKTQFLCLCEVFFYLHFISPQANGNTFVSKSIYLKQSFLSSLFDIFCQKSCNNRILIESFSYRLMTSAKWRERERRHFFGPKKLCLTSEEYCEKTNYFIHNRNQMKYDDEENK